ncbi:MAG: Ppx/GppA phosphatase family protein [Novosphingobium sp.]|uniref:Ppx/GppA phosphatase family protein n=1 Tax=Novosphingobium sp. TaxID=1874826 RepID=UPI003C7A7920
MADNPPPAMREAGAAGNEALAGGAGAPADAAQTAPQQRRSGEKTRNGADAGPASPWVPSAREAPYHRQAFAAIDLGTNNCRLLIARPAGDHFTVIDAFSRVVRLGEGLAQSGRLSEAAMDRALTALKVCAEKLKRRNVHLARSVATEACRRAENGAEFIDRVAQETGILLDVISAKEEARLAVMGCHLLLEEGDGPAMIFDIGGGSTELVLVESRDGRIPLIHDWHSVPWGVVSLTESVAAEPDDALGRAERYDAMRQLVRDSLMPFAERVEAEASAPLPLRLLGTSGTVTTLASLHLELPQYDRRAVDGLVVASQDMAALCERLALFSPLQRREQPCIGRERADLVVAGCAILQTIIELWPADRLGVADRGIREGILRSLMASSGSGEKSRAALRLARRGAA